MAKEVLVDIQFYSISRYSLYHWKLILVNEVKATALDPLMTEVGTPSSKDHTVTNLTMPSPVSLED